MEIIVEKKNKKDARYLKECYCGRYGNLSTFLLFKYEYIYFSKIDNNFSLNMNKISDDSLSHFEIMGKFINLLGEKPEFETSDFITQFFFTDKTKVLEINIRLMKEQIILYTNCLNKIEDVYVKDILKKFIIEDRKNLEILEILQLKNKPTKYNLD